MDILIDRDALDRVYLHRVARGRCYYLAEPPVLGIIVVRWPARIEELAGLVVDAALGHEFGVEGWCQPGWAGRKHGKMTIYRVVGQHGLAQETLSAVLDRWRAFFPMR